ncbi:tyrosine-type recombinase/integrase [Vibrio sp. SCSIO 43137]|uniref:tyrosine-type recombinase/integrase n=1 Tax=Vibrio sp. SCSIO 43137 TaxID=3021011 RepID=UPI002307832D|nr:tyrosine-type recombinase/integrase [Vibrio sp. SCSIO 43137]WCE28799.1 tyrosine-type recombinase/integrase [Vibrio sp. SCSIO 43137]
MIINGFFHIWGMTKSIIGLTETMYLFKTASHNYYTRICLPKSARDRGFPYDLKISLLTKNRRLASMRNLTVAIELKRLIDGITLQTKSHDFKVAADALINELRSAFTDEHNEGHAIAIPVRHTSTEPSPDANMRSTSSIVSLKDAKASFVKSKELQSIKPLTIYQLESRIRHFVQFVDTERVADVTTAHALLYRDELLKQGRSYKTNKEYLAACLQFFKYCKLMNHTVLNPFEDVKVQNKGTKRQDEQRDRWSLTELAKFFNCHQFSEKDEEFKWISRIQPLSGMRPSEVCQLRVTDIRREDGIHYFSINDSADGKTVKNLNSIRKVPIHNHLIEMGFLGYVKMVKAKGNTQLFSYIPANQFDDWSKSFCSQMGKFQTAIGMKPKQRPTAYGFRHTFIDELKQQDVPEHVTAQIVGHGNNSMTYGRYGKRLSLEKLALVVNQVSYAPLFEGSE